ncbi:MAG: hypothetical protein ACRDL7_07670, partial [Gaiellaceae bacterium]
RGYTLRAYDGREPKAMMYMDNEEPHMSWYRGHMDGSVIVVEDQPSAVRAALYMDSVAMCGTGCSRYYALEIAAHAQRVVWALDGDVLPLAVKVWREHQLLFERSQVLPLDEDLKNMDEQSLMDLIGGLRWKN